MKIYTFWSPKGGQGCSVTAAAVANMASEHQRVALMDFGIGHGDQKAIFGSAASAVEWGREIVPNIRLWEGCRGSNVGEAIRSIHELGQSDVIIQDFGTNGPWSYDSHGIYAVVRADYLALRRMCQDHNEAAMKQTDGVIVVQEEGRALRSADIENVTSKPVTAVTKVSDKVARAVDAGVFHLRMPQELRAALAGIVPAPDSCTV